MPVAKDIRGDSTGDVQIGKNRHRAVLPGGKKNGKTKRKDIYRPEGLAHSRI